VRVRNLDCDRYARENNTVAGSRPVLVRSKNMGSSTDPAALKSIHSRKTTALYIRHPALDVELMPHSHPEKILFNRVQLITEAERATRA
jgi:hypothetical protein